MFDFFSRKSTCRFLVNADGKVAEKYRHFREFLCHNRDALNLIAELEQTYYDGSDCSLGAVKERCAQLVATVSRLLAALDGLARGKYAALAPVLGEIAAEIERLLAPLAVAPNVPLVQLLTALGPDQARWAGAKAANLAAVRNVLALPTPSGFVITARAWEYFLTESGLAAALDEALATVSTEMIPEMAARCAGMQEMVLRAELPRDLGDAILAAAAALTEETGGEVRLAMRSSAIGEDTTASFAGQYATVLNVTRADSVAAYKTVVASKYTPRAIAYRLRYGLDDRDTPMAVAAIVMINARSSGVLYTVDPAASGQSCQKICAIWGLGEQLVSGEIAPDTFLVDRATGAITAREIALKESRLVNLPDGGTALQAVSAAAQGQPALDDQAVTTLARYGLELERYFGGPQDVEWVLDEQNRIIILQSRPLGLTGMEARQSSPPLSLDGHTVLLAAGKTASAGTATGTVVLATGRDLGSLPEKAILVARAALPDYAAYIGKVQGLITDTGGVASHLASVAREFGIPAIFATGNATEVLKEGQPVTMVAATCTVYDGMISELAATSTPMKRYLFDSPLHLRLRAVLDRISPLNLTDPGTPEFQPAGCRTVHDIIRFAHEQVMAEMFRLATSPGDAIAVRLTADIPLALYCIDLGGGLRDRLTTCDTITADHLESVPMRALWRGLSHPGITWSGTINLSLGSFMTLMASSATAETGGGMPGGNSYAVLSRDYLNLSVKFGYHYANIDTFCGEDPDQNHITLQFSGGAGSYVGRSLRLQFLAAVLGRLGFAVTITGDLLAAVVKGYDRQLMVSTLDQLGRLMASSRLLDMAIPGQAEVEQMTAAFFQGDYDFLNESRQSVLPGFYTHIGHWRRVEEEGRLVCRQDGSDWGAGLSAGLARLMGRMVGPKYQEFLDNIGAYYYFPLAIWKDGEAGDASYRVRVRPLAGNIDQAGGLAFAIRNIGNYFVWRLNALEDNLILFEFVNGKRFARASVHRALATGQWYELRVDLEAGRVQGYLDGEPLIDYQAGRPLSGYAGLWTKADSVTSFADLVIAANGGGNY